MKQLTAFRKLKMYVVYWLVYILLFSLIQGLPAKDFITALINECFSIFPKICFVFLVVEVLMPQFLFKKKKEFFVLGYLVLIILFAILQRLIDNYIIIKYIMLHWKIEPLFSAPVYLYSIIKLQFAVTVPVCLKLFWHLAVEQHKVQEIVSEKLQAELTSLRNQFHPHFLFNVLNSLYVKILNKSDDSAAIVLKISDLLRFSIYEFDRKNITLEEELTYLKNYIDLQQLRFDNRLDLSFSIFGSIENYKIEPFLLLPFVENSYKYCLDNDETLAWITISINVVDHWLVFKIENSLPNTNNYQLESNVSPQDRGTGIANVKRRLELLYPNQHQLTIKNNDSSFFVSLKIKMNDVV
jgi:two-component system LytT family sensor kinase